MANAANLSQSKVYTVTSRGCLVGDRTQIGSPSKFLVSRQGLTFPLLLGLAEYNSSGGYTTVLVYSLHNILARESQDSMSPKSGRLARLKITQ